MIGAPVRVAGILLVFVGTNLFLVEIARRVYPAARRLPRVPPLPVPQLLAPPAESIFSRYPRTVTLSWKPVAGAASYTVQVDAFDPQTCSGCRLAPGWISER